jgi:SAM-dependent methyltransferase
MWDGWVPIHLRSDFYDVDAFLSGENTLQEFEIAEVGDVRGKNLLHLQCHFGLDTLSWARLGATVTGVDFSEPAIVGARELAAQAGLTPTATFVVSDVYDAPSALADRRFDIVYVSWGALVWLPDLARWAEVVSQCLTPGGFLYLAEAHPFLRAADDDYFRAEPEEIQSTETYADPNARTPPVPSYEWAHPLGQIVTAIADTGLRISFLHEFPGGAYRRLGFDEVPASRPAMYTLKAVR